MTYEKIKQDIIANQKYQSLKNDYHHGLNRYLHIMHVAKISYYISKFLKLDYISTTRGALLHDYFNEDDYLDIKGLDKPRIHPFLSLNYAKKYYNLNTKEENIIISHMYPIGKIKPVYIESWVVTFVDKGVATYEYIHYKFRDKFMLYCLFLINLISIKL